MKLVTLVMRDSLRQYRIYSDLYPVTNRRRHGRSLYDSQYNKTSSVRR